MLLIPCPWCGPRDETEFACGGEAHIARPTDPEKLSDAEWARLPLHARATRKGVHHERWMHRLGCRRWFNVARNTVTHRDHPRLQDGRAAARGRIDRGVVEAMTGADRLPAGGRIDRRARCASRFNGRALRRASPATRSPRRCSPTAFTWSRAASNITARAAFSRPARRSRMRWCSSMPARAPSPTLRATQVELYDGLVAAEPEPLAVAQARPRRRQRLALAPVPGRLLLQDLHVAAGLVDDLRALHPPGGGPGPARRAEPDPDRYDKMLRALRRAGGRRRSRRPRGRARRGPSGRPRPARRRAGRAGRQPARPRRHGGIDRRRARAPQWLGTALAELAALPEVHGSAAHHGLRLSRPQPRRPVERLHRSSAAAGRRAAAPAAVARAREAGGARDRRASSGRSSSPTTTGRASCWPRRSQTYVNRYGGARRARRAVVFTNNDGAYRRRAGDLMRRGHARWRSSISRPDPRGPLPRRARSARHRRAGRPCRRRDATAASASRAVEVDAARPGRTAVTGVAAPHRLRSGRGVGRLESDRASLLAVAAAGCGSTTGWRRFVPGDRRPARTRRPAPRSGTFALGRALAEGFAAGPQPPPRAGLPRQSASAPPGRGRGPCAAARRCGWCRARSRSAAGRSSSSISRTTSPPPTSASPRARVTARSSMSSATPTTGMGTDQGKTSNVNALAILVGDARHADPAGRHHHLPAALHAGHLRRLRRRAISATCSTRSARTADPWLGTRSTARCSRMSASGSAPGTSPGPARPCTRRSTARCKAVRSSVGIVDASTLGKIDIQGPDAVKLLNWVYTNAWDKLAVGRCRYGLMLRRERHGVRRRRHHAARRAPLPHDHHHRRRGARAGLAGGLAADASGRTTRSTSPRSPSSGRPSPSPGRTRASCWPSCADGIAARRGSFPFMSVREGTVAGIPARVLRISFTGELSYEINVPASYASGAVAGADRRPARNTTSPPTAPRRCMCCAPRRASSSSARTPTASVTPGDLGMDWIVSKKKPGFPRPALAAPQRHAARGPQAARRPPYPQSVGGAARGRADSSPTLKPKPPMKMLGHVTSSYYSPNRRSLDRAGAGRGRTAADGRDAARAAPRPQCGLTVVEPRFFDPEGARLNG